MKYNDCFLPNGQKVSVTPVFQGYKFVLENEDPTGSFPPQWTISIRTKEPPGSAKPDDEHDADPSATAFTTPSLDGDMLYLSSMSMPATKDLKPESASTRQIAMLLWITFSWYFHEPEPNLHASTPHDVPESARIVKDWRLTIEPKGILGGKDKMKKLERLGIVACEDASVGAGADDKSGPVDRMFISQQAFWQLDPRLYLFSLTASELQAGSVRANPISSLDTFGAGFPFAAGPKTFGMFLPSYYPPQPLQYTFSGNIRHPVRPKAPRQGEVFYVRYIPSGGKYLTLRLPVLPTNEIRQDVRLREQASGQIGPDLCLDYDLANDVKLLHKWMEERPTDTSLAQKGPASAQAEFLRWRLSSKNSYPALACFDSIPVGYFEFFWVLEDELGPLLGDATEWDRGIRCFIGEKDFITPPFTKIFLSSLIHHCWLYDQRTQAVILDVRADNMKFVPSLESIGLTRDREVNFPHERNIIMKARRETWRAPST